MDKITQCPVCNGPLIRQKCKIVCYRCGTLVENCSGD